MLFEDGSDEDIIGRSEVNNVTKPPVMIKPPYSVLKIIIVEKNLQRKNYKRRMYYSYFYRTDKNNTYYHKIHLIH